MRVISKINGTGTRLLECLIGSELDSRIRYNANAVLDVGIHIGLQLETVVSFEDKLMSR